MRAAARRLVARARALYRREPARVNAWVAGGATAVLLRVGLHVDGATVLAVVAFVLPAVAGEATRRRVTPVPRPRRRR